MRSSLLLTVALLRFFTSAFAQTNYARDLVNPFVGTGGHGHTFPGACVPNGLVQLSPDTRTDGYNDWDGCGGYHYNDSMIYGFSHTHLSGTGIADLCDVLLMPMSGTFSLDPKEYRSHFSHQSEEAHAGFYRVHLDDENVDAEVTATPHVGVHRYSMPVGRKQFLVLDLRHRDKLIRASITRVSEVELVGERRSSSWANDQHLFFCIRLNTPYEMVPNSMDSTKAVLALRSGAAPLIVKVGISAVSIEGARANLDAEVPGWDFDAVRKQAEDAWNAKLNKIEVTGGTHEEQRIFYTALYHCYVAPYLFSDVDGNYRGMDGQVHHADHNVYTVFSLWDTFRALHPLMTILEPEMTSDFIKTFLLHYQQGGKLPVWELWGNETNCMIGYHSVSVIADAYFKGIRDFDKDLALEAMVASANRSAPDLAAFRKRGYISSEDAGESVSKTLEYAYDDHCAGIFANVIAEEARGDSALLNARYDRRDSLHSRSNAWQNVFDPRSKFFRSRRNGGFVQPFDPYEVNFNYTEANAWQYSMFVPGDMERFTHLLGGKDSLAARLDQLFSARNSTSGREQADITGLIGQYAQGNEPSHNMAYLYNYAGKPERTRNLVHRILSEMYHDTPDGLAGNEDCGQMSAWYVFSALGFYPVSPGPYGDVYELGYPVFDRARIRVSRDTTFEVTVDTDRSMKPALPKDTSNMIVHQRTSIRHEEIMQGQRIVVGPDRACYPFYSKPSSSLVLSSRFYRTPSPIIQAKAATFRDSLRIILDVAGGDGLQFRIDTAGAGPHSAFAAYSAPFWLTHSASVLAVGQFSGDTTIAHFTKLTDRRSVKLGSTYSDQYAAGGEQALVDGLRGGSDFRSGEWQGFQGEDVLATVDLGEVRTLKRAGLSMLQDQHAWIWYPETVDIAWSTNGRTWSSVTLQNSVDRHADGGRTQELWSDPIGKHARYVKVIAKNAGPCPDWHPGKGGRTWIFLDEILIETE